MFNGPSKCDIRLAIAAEEVYRETTAVMFATPRSRILNEDVNLESIVAVALFDIVASVLAVATWRTEKS